MPRATLPLEIDTLVDERVASDFSSPRENGVTGKSGIEILENLIAVREVARISEGHGETFSRPRCTVTAGVAEVTDEKRDGPRVDRRGPAGSPVESPDGRIISRRVGQRERDKYTVAREERQGVGALRNRVVRRGAAGGTNGLHGFSQ